MPLSLTRHRRSAFAILTSSQVRFERAAGELFAEPLRLAVVDEFRWFCEQRRVLEQTRAPRGL